MISENKEHVPNPIASSTQQDKEDSKRPTTTGSQEMEEAARESFTFPIVDGGFVMDDSDQDENQEEDGEKSSLTLTLDDSDQESQELAARIEDMIRREELEGRRNPYVTINEDIFKYSWAIDRTEQ